MLLREMALSSALIVAVSAIAQPAGASFMVTSQDRFVEIETGVASGVINGLGLASTDFNTFIATVGASRGGPGLATAVASATIISSSLMGNEFIAEGQSNAASTQLGGKNGFASADTFYSVFIEVTELIPFDFSWAISSFAVGGTAEQTVEVFLAPTGGGMPIASAQLADNGFLTGSLNGTLDVGTYHLFARAFSETDTTGGGTNLSASTGFSFNLTLVPSPGAVALAGLSGLMIMRRRRDF